MFICLPLSLRRKHYLTIALPRSSPVSCSILPGLPCVFLLPSPCPMAVRPCLHFCLLPSSLSLSTPRARSLLHPPREATSRAKVSLCQVATCPAWGSGSAGATLQTSSRISAVSSLPWPQGSGCLLLSLGRGMLPHIRGLVSPWPAAGPPFLLLARHRFVWSPPFPESLRVCWLPAPAWRILFLPLRQRMLKPSVHFISL